LKRDSNAALLRPTHSSTVYVILPQVTETVNNIKMQLECILLQYSAVINSALSVICKVQCN